MNKGVILIIAVTVLISCNRPVRQLSKTPRNQIESEIPSGSTNLPEKVIPTPSTTKRDSENLHAQGCFLHGKIVRVVDGDTAELLYGKLTVKLRLEHIDAPEKRGTQPFGNKAKQQLSDLCFGQHVCIVGDGETDKYGRLIGVIINQSGVNVNKEMVRLGYAWHFKKYSDDVSYDKLEKQARLNRAGLWRDEHPVAPWDFR